STKTASTSLICTAFYYSFMNLIQKHFQKYIIAAI
ncbi:MAG: hypothetical protein ACI9LF_001740, partial [Flavobacteriales bacterium]